MCVFKAPKVPPVPPPVQYQAMQQPKEMMQARTGMDPRGRMRRGLYASIFTSPSGVSSAPAVTGTSGGTTGG